MVQKFVSKDLPKGEEKNQTSNEVDRNTKDVDDATTVAPPSLIYSRNDRSLHQYENNLLDMDDSQTIMDEYGDIMNDNNHDDPFTSIDDPSRHRRTSSNDRMISARLSQWNYNNNRVILNRSIAQVYDILKQLQQENEKRPINIKTNGDDKVYVLDLNIQLDGTYSNNNNSSSNHEFNIGNSDNISVNEEAKDDNIFDLDKNALSKLFKLKIKTVLNHLNSLQKRVDDVSSKVFITGDVNTGKSSFCNSLLKRKLLPEDQLPCTNVFCEILEARENANREEIHAILTNSSNSNARDTFTYSNNMPSTTNIFNYNILDMTTYEIHDLYELSNLVQRNDKYSLLKIYIKDDKRDAEKSLLRNGTVDISLIDSPGLNIDSIQTAEVMTRQEEIDLVVFVVNAENQLTLSAQDFVKVASREKKLMFFVVKKFDKIRDKERCKQLILNQIKNLSPETYKSGKDFIHFLDNDPDEYPYNRNQQHPDDGDSSDDDDNSNNNKDNHDNFNDPDFEHLENSLRNFVLKKRSMSKLLPAKTFLYKILNDLEHISRYNLEIFTAEDTNIADSLQTLLNEVSKTRSHYDKFIKKIDTLVDSTVSFVYNSTKEEMELALNLNPEDDEYPQYQGFSQIYDYVTQMDKYIKSQIQSSIIRSESIARKQTDLSVQNIYTLVRNELDANFMEERQFDNKLMYSRSYHSLAKQLNVSMKFSDLYSPSWSKFMEYIGFHNLMKNPFKLLEKGPKPTDLEVQLEKTATKENNNAVTSFLELSTYPLIKYVTQPSLIFTSKLPAVAIYSLGGSQLVKNIMWNGIQTFSWKYLGQIIGSSLMITALLGTSYLVYDLPRVLPLNLTYRYRTKLNELKYIDTNAKRVSHEVATVLKVPTREIVKTCELEINQRESNKYELESRRDHNKISISFFRAILDRVTTQKTIVEGVDVDVD